MSEPAPATPARLKSVVVRNGNDLCLRCRNQERGGFFLLLWLTGWTVGCVFLAAMVFARPTVFEFLFAIPFWASWIFVAALVLKRFFQVEELHLNRAGALLSRRIGSWRKNKRSPLEDLKKVGIFQVVDSETGHKDLGLELLTVGHPLRMFLGLPDDELHWLVHQVNEHLTALRGGVSDIIAGAPLAADISEMPAAPEQDASGDAAILILSGTAAAPPADSAWTRGSDPSTLSFERKGSFPLAAIGGLLFINLFWNGIVSVFVSVLLGIAPVQGGGQGGVPAGAAWWGLCVFLIPFEVIGLLMLAALVAALAEPFHRTVWMLSPNAIKRRHSWWGFGPQRTWPVEKLARLDLRSESERQKTRNLKFRSAEQLAERLYRVLFIDDSNRELCAIAGLTEGEARWIAKTVLRERPEWFR